MKIDDFTLDVAGDKTPGRLFIPEDAGGEWAVLWLQGFTSTIDGHAEGVARMSDITKTTFAMLNYAGHGNHPIALKDATRKQQLAEVIALYDAVRAQGYSKIIAIGGSFGAYMATLLAAERPLQTVVLRAPAIYADEEFELPYRDTRSGKTDKDTWREGITEQTSNSALSAMRAFGGNVFVIEHELDSIINPQIPKTYAAVTKHANYIVIPGCDHSPKLMPEPEKFFTIIENWLQTIIINTKLADKL